MENDYALLAKNLKRHNMDFFYAESRGKLLSLLTEFIRAGSTVGCGDSVTLEESGVFDFLRTYPCTFYDKHQKGLISSEKREIYIKNFSADTFITGTNAITEEGGLFNIDGNGSRVAPIIYGPLQVIVVVGKNKIVPDFETALLRTRQIAAPLDASRLKKETPCVKLKKCINCNHKDRICNSFVYISRQAQKNRIKVILLNEEIGY